MFVFISHQPPQFKSAKICNAFQQSIPYSNHPSLAKRVFCVVALLHATLLNNWTLSKQ